jgi:hypothetical protein
MLSKTNIGDNRGEGRVSIFHFCCIVGHAPGRKSKYSHRLWWKERAIISVGATVAEARPNKNEKRSPWNFATCK